jgi:hypothetical protein
MNVLVAQDKIEKMIFVLREKRVMIDSDIAMLYAVETKQLKRAVRRNIERFPDDFMFELTKKENEILRSQFGTLRWGVHAKYLPYAFTENGVAMLSSVLRSDRAVQINIQIMRAFTRLRSLLVENKDIRLALEKLERRVDKHDMQIQVAFNSLKSLLEHRNDLAPAKSEYSPDGGKRAGFVPNKA